MELLSLFVKAKADLTESELHLLMEIIKAVVGIVIFLLVLKKRKQHRKEQEERERKEREERRILEEKWHGKGQDD